MYVYIYIYIYICIYIPPHTLASPTPVSGALARFPTTHSCMPATVYNMNPVHIYIPVYAPYSPTCPCVPRLCIPLCISLHVVFPRCTLFASLPVIHICQPTYVSFHVRPPPSTSMFINIFKLHATGVKSTLILITGLAVTVCELQLGEQGRDT